MGDEKYKNEDFKNAMADYQKAIEIEPELESQYPEVFCSLNVDEIVPIEPELERQYLEVFYSSKEDEVPPDKDELYRKYNSLKDSKEYLKIGKEKYRIDADIYPLTDYFLSLIIGLYLSPS